MVKKYENELFLFNIVVSIDNKINKKALLSKIDEDEEYREVIDKIIDEENESTSGGYCIKSDGINECIILIKKEHYEKTSSLIGVIGHELLHCLIHFGDKYNLGEETRCYLIQYYIAKIIEDFNLIDKSS